LFFFFLNQNTKKYILDKRTKNAKKNKNKDQSDFKLLGHQVCLETKQLGGK
jgi:hypothetical protein